MADCSELALVVTYLSTMIMAEPGVRNLDDVVARLKTFEGLESMNREEVASYIAEASRGKAVNLSEAAQLVADIKREARLDVSTRKQINEFLQHIKMGTLPETSKKAQKETTPAIVELRAIRDSLKSEINSGDAAKIKRVEKSIARLDKIIKDLDTGDYVIPVVNESKIRESNLLKRKRFELHRKRRDVNNRIDSLKGKSVWGYAREVFDIPRAMTASTDFSAPGRQGKFFQFARPIHSIKAGIKMFRGAFSGRFEYEMMDKILNSPEAGDYHIGKLYFAPLEGDRSSDYTDQEDTHRSDVASKIPVIGHVIKASNRAYNVYLNALRASVFDAMKKNLTAMGEPTQSELESIGRLVNEGTGRGARVIGELGDIMFFSQRYMSSRISLSVGNSFWRADGNAKKIVAREYARAIIGASVFAMFLTWFGYEPVKEKLSSDLLKIRRGKTRLDLFGGLQAMFVLGAKTVTGKSVSPVTGKEKKLVGGGFKTRDLRDEYSDRLGWFKLTPTLGALFSARIGENVVGENRDIRTLEGAKGLAGDLFVPMSTGDIISAMKEEGVSAGAALGIFALFGEGLQIFDNRNPGEKR